MPTVAELAKQELDRRYSLQGRTQVAPRPQTMQNVRPTIRSALSNLLRDAVDATGLTGGYRQGLLNAAGDVESAVDFLPVVGDAIAVDDAARSYEQGDMLGAGINLMGVVPVVGDVASKAAKTSRSNWSELPRMPNSDEKIIDIPISMIEHGEAAMSGGTLSFPDAQKTIQEYAQRNTEIPAIDVVTPDEDSPFFMVEDGSRRLEAAKLRGDKTIKAIVPRQYNEVPQAGQSSLKLDMTPEARMQRAKDLGFDTGRTAYRGIRGQYDPEKSGYYQMFTSSPQDAKEYGENVISAYTRRGNNLSLDAGKRNFNDIPVNKLPEDVRKNLHYTLNEPNSVVRTDDIAHAAREAGYDSVTINNVFDKASNEIPLKPSPVSNASMSQEMMDLLDEVDASGILNNTPDASLLPAAPKDYEPATIDIIFDPKNIRSIEAEFDPAKADSADLLSSVGATSALRGIA